MIRALVVDDEPIARAGIVTLLGTEHDVTVLGECRDGVDAVERIRADRPDLVFLDVQMPELDGFEVLAALGPSAVPATVFVTAYDQYALDAFEASAVDYLLKPFDRERFARAVARARRFLAGDQLATFRAKVASVLEVMGGESSRAARARDSRLLIRSRGKVTFLPLADIAWVETSGNYVRVRADGVWHTVREPLRTFAQRVDTTRFAQVSRSCLVNLDRVREIRRQPNGQHIIVLDDGGRLVASRRFGAKLLPDVTASRPLSDLQP
jgi:two-component system LytT family response regulator